MQVGRGVVVIGPREKLQVAEGARLWPGVVISTETGPVFIDSSAAVRPGSFIEGPCYVGPGTVIDGARIRPGCSFGPHCRIGGEVEASVFQGYANKHHDGFIGHSFVGEWANLGALTTNSDLKNAYQPVQVFYGGRPVDSGLLKVGCYIGDHVKTAIGTLLNTGARVGTFANWFEPGLSPKEIPAFAWGARARWPVQAAVENARQVMSRRVVVMSPAYERALRALFRSQKNHKEH
jgi:UDP-N-acetylglucosamine diphosphorylase/glucosamine-1-phosphate N-acetyltransferase